MRRFVLVQRCTLLPLLATLAACSGAPTPPVANVQPPVASVAGVAPSAAGAPPTATIVPTTAPTNTPAATPQPTIAATPTTRPDVSALAGENSFARGSVGRRPWMVMIDNHPNAYPQSGLDGAAMVFEGLAEYGVTRFIALYNDGGSPDMGEIGPVRSTRLYFAQWAMGFHPVYAHAGGSPDGIALAESTDQLINFEALRENKYTWRDGNRAAPHNLYTRSELLRQFAADKGVSDPVDPDAGYLFNTIAPAAPPEVTTIDYNFLTDGGSRAGFRYDPATSNYLRVMRGRPHTDRVTGQQLWTRNVVVMQVNEEARVGDAKQRIDQNVIGSGAARFFIAGQAIDGTWRKNSPETALRFFDANDQEIVFNLGPVWVAAIPTLERLTTQ